MAAFHADGSVEGSFGTNGVAITELEADCKGEDLAIAPDGKILVCGHTGSGWSVQPGDLFVARYTAEGGPDETFGTGGTVITTIDPTGDAGHAIAVAPDGKIVVAGEAGGALSAFDSDLAVVRYLGDDATTHLNAPEHDKPILAPNLATDHLWIRLAAGDLPATMEVTDALGRTVMRRAIHTDHEGSNIAQLGRGHYHVRVRTASNSYVLPFLKW